MNPYRQNFSPNLGSKDIEVTSVFGDPESFVRVNIRTSAPVVGVATVTLSKQAADDLARALLIASCGCKAMDMK